MTVVACIVINGGAAVLNYVAYKAHGHRVNEICVYISGGIFIATLLGYIVYGAQ